MDRKRNNTMTKLADFFVLFGTINSNEAHHDFENTKMVLLISLYTVLAFRNLSLCMEAAVRAKVEVLVDTKKFFTRTKLHTR
jgi:hypothetical protein